MNLIRRLWSVDTKLSWRDPMTAACLVGPVVLTLAMRFALPRVVNVLPWPIDLAIYRPLLGASLALFIPVLYGVVMGFLILDEKDDGTHLALQVTPLSRSSLTLYRVTSPSLQAIVAVLVALPLSGMIRLPLVSLLATALLCSLGAPLYAFTLAAFAGNKIEGLALSKLLGLPMMSPLLSLFLPSQWHFVLWPIPFYWPFRFVLRIQEGASWSELLLIWVVGMLLHIGYIVAITRLRLRAR